MKVTALNILALTTLVAGLTCPNNSGGGCGQYTVSGLGSRKTQIKNAGGSSRDLAIAMMETEKMDTNYAYGDNKSGDAANFGIFKQNWGMLRASCSQFKGQSSSQYNNGAVLNSNLASDLSCRHQGESYYGYQKWVAGHRNGASGLANPNTADINLYKGGVDWTEQQLNGGHLSDNERFWVDVVPI
ncbi:hypothetical protein V499_01291 [Pseudogymnoascus sp. VKM F-103]|uniref:Uncharacterized protein n=1 Tax=Pseudogymnoascus verrucosus TaxID=342668 RepID=A0A1B8GLK5_9PEZI|nr:uncharacterized protein VE01_04077 [Pseudogymnoascus verrucosus]KFY79750.1 hypothetical protein V499_01291 [Pseudogymnoascus sp. VKM F-103]OBT96723.1 hypothetical protein VE01_04077 [Pseudogymnoascus verrucosus]